MTRFYKTKIKEYPNGTKQLTVYKNTIFVENGSNSITLSNTDEIVQKEVDKDLEQRRAIWKIKTKIKDYVLCNDFNTFWTMTFEKDRYDYDLAFEKMSKWLRKMRDRHGKFDYIVIPELHKDGAIHFHAVFGNFGGKLIDSGVKHRNVTVFNCPEWEYGFTTITRMRNKEKCASYVTKYFTKQMQETIVKKGQKKYWLSKGLEKPVVTYSADDLGENLQPTYTNDVCSIYKL